MRALREGGAGAQSLHVVLGVQHVQEGRAASSDAWQDLALTAG